MKFGFLMCRLLYMVGMFEVASYAFMVEVKHRAVMCDGGAPVFICWCVSMLIGCYWFPQRLNAFKYIHTAGMISWCNLRDINFDCSGKVHGSLASGWLGVRSNNKGCETGQEETSCIFSTIGASSRPVRFHRLLNLVRRFALCFRLVHLQPSVTFFGPSLQVVSVWLMGANWCCGWMVSVWLMGANSLCKMLECYRITVNVSYSLQTKTK
ncbi:hypothetical protein M8C21_002937, partial [Ambrosia artemisiifolia]